MLAEFALTVMYTQIMVAAVGGVEHGLLWTDAHGAQGFAWSPGLAAFGVPDHDGQVLIQVETLPTPRVEPDALWAVQVPFEVPPGSVEIGTILDERAVRVPAGRYDLVFQALHGTWANRTYAYVIRLSFVPSDTPAFAILKRGNELKTDKVLRTDAEALR